VKKNLLLLLLVLFQTIITNAQTAAIDSIKQLLQNEKQDTSRAMLLYQLELRYIYSKPDTALLLAREMVELSRKINFARGEATGLRGVAVVFENTGNYPAALSADLEALKIAEEAHDQQNIANLLSSISDVYFYQGDIPRSVDYSYRSIAMYKQQKDSARLQVAFSNLGDTYEKTNQLDSALLYTRLGYKLANPKNNPAALGVSISNIGNVLRKMDKTDSAMLYYKQAIPYFAETNNDDGFSELYLGIADIFLHRNQPDSALYYAKLSYTIAKQGNFIDKLLAASNFLAEYYKGQRNVDSAYAYQAATIAAKDSMFSQQKINEMQSLTYDEAMRQQQIEDAKEQERVRARQNALIGGLFTLLVVAFLLIRNNRQRRKANELLQQQKEEIDNKAKELSVQKDNLQQSYNNVEQLGVIGRKITSSLSVEEIISTVYKNVNALMDASVFGIGIYNDNSKQLEFPSTYENGEALPFYANSIDDKNRFGAVCFSNGQEIIMGNLDKEYKNYVQHVHTPHEGEQPVSIIFLPLMAKEKKLGVITVQSFKENTYSDYHLFMLRNIANYTAIAIENAESYESLNEAMSTLKSTQAQLIQSEKMASLGELTAGIAHEIQNPLNFVNNFSEVNRELIEELKSEKSKLKNEEIDDLLNDIAANEEKINHHGKRADAIVKGMLQHSRSSTSQKEPTDINALCDEYLRLSYHGLRAKDTSFNAEMKTNFDDNLVKINIISQDVGRVLLNLFTNAFYAVTEKKKSPYPLKGDYKPTVSVFTKRVHSPSGDGGNVEIIIADNGNGIPKNIVDKIFQPFFTTKPAGEGTGLGLSISYDIIKAHGGEIKVETSDGEGTKFIILLPAM